MLLLLTIACGAAATATPAPTAIKAPVAAPTATKAPAAAPTATKAPTPAAAVTKAPAATATPVPTAAPAKVSGVPDWVKRGKRGGGIIPLVWIGNPGFWDVHYGGSLTTTLTPSGPRFNQLVEYNPVSPDQIVGDLAESWEVSKDGLTYTFRLHNAKWSDGKPVTADDVVFSLDRIVEPGATRARTAALRDFYDKGTAKAIDPKTILVPIKFPAPTFLIELASDYQKMYPKHIVQGKSQDDLNCCPENLLGSGPFIFKEWKRGDSYEYVRNPNYFKEGRPFLDGFRVFLILETSRAISALKVGQVMGTYGPVLSVYQPQDVQQLEKDTGGKMRALTMPNVQAGGFQFNISKPPFDSPKVRRAVYLAIDRREAVEIVFKGFGNPGTFFPFGTVEEPEKLAQSPGYRYTAEGKKDPKDLEEAKRLMAEAGYPNGFKATLNTSNAKIAITQSEVVAEQLRRSLNIDFTISPKETAAYYVDMRDGTHPATLGAGTGIIIWDPSDTVNQYLLKDVLRNPHNWSHPRVDELIAAQNQELDPVKRLALFKEMADILHRGESHYAPILWQSSGGALDYRLRNYYVPRTIQLVHKWEHVWFDPEAKIPTASGYVP